jgi:hypothetical protein
MRKAGILLIAVACGGGQQQTTTNDVHLDKPDAAISALPNKPVQPLGIPHDAPFVASFDATAAARIVPLRQELERELDLDEGALVSQAAALGLDTKRPVTIAVAPLDDAEMKAVTELQAQFKDPSVMPSDDVIKRILAIDSPLVIRVLVPTTNAEKLEQGIAKFLQHDRWKKNANGWMKHGQFIAFDDDGQNVAVDVMIAHEKADPRSLRAFAATAHDPVPALEGRAARASWSPQAIAAIGYLTGIVRSASAVSNDSIDPSQRARIMREGLTEAAQSFTMANFDRVEMEGRLAPFEFVGRAKPSTSFAMPGADAFAQSTGVVSGGRPVAVAQASRAFLKGWPFPGGSLKSAIESMKDGGGGAIFAGLPHLLAMLPAIESRRSRDAAPFDLGRFERVASIYSQGGEDAFISVMPAGAKRADAECAFAPKAPCDAKTKLKLNAVVKVGDLNAKLYEIDKRFVIVSSDSDSAKLEAPTFTQAGGMRLDVDTTVVTTFLAPNTLPAKVAGEITNENGTLVFRAK